MKRKNGNSYTIKGSGISSFSIFGFLCFFLIIPLVLSLYVILDYKPYIEGYEEHLKTNIVNNEITALNNNMSLKQAIYFNMNLDRDSYEEIEKSINGKAYIKQN